MTGQIEPVRSSLLILRARLRAFRRGVGAHAFEIFVLGPVIAGGALWVLGRQLAHLRAPIAAHLDAGAFGSPGAPSLALALALIAVAVPATFRELFDHRRADGTLDALPIPAGARLHAALAVELARALPAGAVLLLAAGALAGGLPAAPAALAAWASRIAAAVLTLALARFAAVLWLAHWRRAWLPVAGVAALGLWAPHPALRLALLPCLAPAAQLETVGLDAVGAAPAASAPWAGVGPTAATALALYLLARFAYLAWHRRDLESAARPARDRRWPRRLALPRRLAADPVAVQVVRDLRLVRRRFSPAVVTSVALALVLHGVALTLLADSGLPSPWRLRLAVVALTLAVLAVVALVPFLLKHELPRFWIEKSTGVPYERIWQAKLWTAALLALAPFALGAVILAAAPGLAPGARWTAVLQLAAAASVVTSIVAPAVFEIAARPLLGLLFGSLVGLALAALFIFYPQAWWLWAVGTLWVAGQIAGRATRRVRLTEVGW